MPGRPDPPLGPGRRRALPASDRVFHVVAQEIEGVPYLVVFAGQQPDTSFAIWLVLN